MWTANFQVFKLDLEKAEEPEIKLPTFSGSSKKQESSRKTSISALLTMPKLLTVWITTNCGKFLKCEYQATLPASWEICVQVKKQQLELDMKQQTGSKSGKEYVRAVYCHPAYLTYMQSERKWKWSRLSCPTLCDPMDCSLPGSSLHGILQATVLEWGAIAFSNNYSSFILLVWLKLNTLNEYRALVTL